MRQNHLLLGIIFIGLTIRLLLIFLPGFKIDTDDWIAWSLRLSNFDFSHFYSKDFFSDYTPGYLYILSLLGFLRSIFDLPNNFFYYLLKIPAAISELLIGFLIYQEIKKTFSQKIVLLSLSFILFNPAMIFNSSIWGQIDSILTLLMLLAIISLKKNNLILSSLFIGLALLVKPQAITLLPLFAIFLVNHLKLSNLFKLLVPAVLIIFIFTFPFFPNRTLINLVQQVINTTKEYPYTSVNAYNFWGVVGFWIPDSQLWNGISYQLLGYILLAGYWALIGYFYFKNKLSLYALAALATLGFFFLPTRVHERYLYPAIVFIILLTTLYKSKLLVALAGILSLLHLLNLYYVYIYYNEFYFNLPKIIYNPLLYNFIASSGKILSLSSVIIFILISITILKYDKVSQKD